MEREEVFIITDDRKLFQLPEDVNIDDEYDIMVFGGGAAGSVAAIQAARFGKRTALIEKNGILGGTTVTASVNFPGLFHAWRKQVIAGIGWEAIERTAELGGATLPDFSTVPSRHWEHQILVNRFIYSTVLDQLCLDAGVHVRFHEMPSLIINHDDGLYVALTGKTGLKWFKVNKIVDATGDANIVGMMGYARKKGEVLQPGTLINEITGYHFPDIDLDRLDELFAEAIEKKEFRQYVPTNSAFFEKALKSGRINMHVQGIDGSDSEMKTAAEIKARQILMESVQFLRKVPGCENIEVGYVANECGIRETWRIDGEVEVDEHSYVTGYVWPDAICYSFYPIDLHHHSENRIVQEHLAPEIVATLPYRALIPKGSEHLLVAGRCVSGDRMANSAFRVQAGCMATGQAAGLAAAIAADKKVGVRDVSVDYLRDQLGVFGAIVPSIDE